MMRLSKPAQLSVLFRTFERQHELCACVSILMPFDLDNGRPVPEAKMWQVAQASLDGGTVLDEGMFKPRAEMLVSGFAFAPGGEAEVCQVSARLGSVQKSLVVVGDRQWGAVGPTAPKPFSRMPLTYAHAFGGEGFDRNPLGKGVAPTRNETGQMVHEMPNLELPDKLIRSPRQRPEPACFGPLDALWPQRHRHFGTYARHAPPGFAPDFDWSYFNVAPVDQRWGGYFAGDEAIVLENMHPERAQISAQLPGLWGRCFLRRRTAGGEALGELENLPLKLDTVHLFPHELLGVVVFRGVTKVIEDDAHDIETLLVACERRGEPRPVSHYEHVLTLREDAERGALHALRDRDLLPEGLAVAAGDVEDMDARLEGDGALFANMRSQMKHTAADVQERMQGAGFEGDVPLPDPPPPERAPSRDELADHIDEVEKEIERQRAHADAQREAVADEVRARCAALQLDEPTMVDPDRGKPPRFDAEERYQSLLAQVELMKRAGVPAGDLERQLEDGTMRRLLLDTEEQLLSTYRRFAHWFPEASRLQGEPAARLRVIVEAALAAGEGLAGRDLTGADLRGIDLSGVDMRGALLADATLAGCRMAEADLTDACLARADLSEAAMERATLTRTNLGYAQLVNTDFGVGAVFDATTLVGAKLEGAKLEKATFRGADVMDMSLARAELSGGEVSRTVFLNVDLSEARLAGANVVDCQFLYPKAAGLDARGSVFRGTSFMDAQLEGANFDGVEAERMCVVGESSLARSSMRGAKLNGCTLERCDMTGADLTEAELRLAVLSGSNLSEATLTGVNAVGVLMQRTVLHHALLTDSNLRDAMLGNADLRGCDLSGSLLFRADLTRVKTSGDTRVKTAEIRFSTFVERVERQEEQP